MFGVKPPPEENWTIHPVIGGAIAAVMSGTAVASATVDWRWALAGSGLGFVAGWGLAYIARRDERARREES